MSVTLSKAGFVPREFADSALKAAAGFWFVVLVVGQVIFATSTAMFYSLTALRGNTQAWNKHLAHGYIPGDTIGNAALIAHIVMAVVIILSGAVQFMPQVRRRAPAFHRWNGRIYIATAFGVSLAGLYLLFLRGLGVSGTPTGLTGEIGTGILAIVIMVCAGMALRYAMRRDIATHRRWAFRLFLVVSSALFVRSYAVLWVLIASGFGSTDLSVVQGSALGTLSFAQFIVPLAVIEVYFWTQRSGGAPARLAMASALVAITLVTGAGIAAASATIFVPNLRASLDPRLSIAAALAATIKSNGVDAAIRQYHSLREARPVVYNFDEDELNVLGYILLRTGKYQDAIRILTLNTEMYPKSGNTWDSLGEAYMDNGDKMLAISNYKKSLVINPANQNGVIMLRKLGRP